MKPSQEHIEEENNSLFFAGPVRQSASSTAFTPEETHNSPRKEVMLSQRFIRAGIRAATFAFAFIQVAQAQVTFETRALTGTDGPLGPGLGSGVNFSDFTSPVLNSTGRTAFAGTLTGIGVSSTNDRGIWSEGGGSGLALIARENSPAPGTAAGVSFSDAIWSGALLLNDAGQTAFDSVIKGTGVSSANNIGIWSEGGGSGLALVARKGDPAPGTNEGVHFSQFFPLVLNDAGQTAFWGSLGGTGVTNANNGGIWSEGGGSGLALVAREGNPAPDTAAGVNFDLFNVPTLNGAGQAAFWGQLAGTGVSAVNDSGIWSEGGGSGLALVAREGNPAPGTTAGVNFRFNDSTFSLGHIAAPVLNDAGQIAFHGFLNGPGVVSDRNDRGIWFSGGDEGLTLVARTGDQAPCTDAGVNFVAFETFVMNSAGQIAFHAFLAGEGVNASNDRGIWSSDVGRGLALVAREGDPAPGTNEGVNFIAFNAPVINGAGQTAFSGNLIGEEVTSANNRGIWLTTGIADMPQLIARSGDLFDVSNDSLNPDLRTISALSLTAGSGGEDGRPRSFNDFGQLAFWASFTDGSRGIFVASTDGLSPAPFMLTITAATAPNTGYDLSWDSKPCKVYDLITSTDLTTPITEWPVHATYSDIPATGTTTTLTSIPEDGPRRFFAVVEKDAPLDD